jgi:hypothetical protein
MFKISHESPICLLEESLNYNDYDYYLIHLLLKYPKYEQFMLEHKGRESILDNSAYELGDSFNPTQFASYIEKYKPSYYVIPDKLGDFDKTYQYYKDWDFNLPSKAIGVIQGNSIETFIEMFNILNNDERISKLAISFGLPIFVTDKIEDNWIININRALRRHKIYSSIKNSLTKPIHLLGSYWCQEFLLYKDENWVESIDTSLPIKLGYELESLNKTIVTKPNIMIDKFFNEDLSNRMKSMMLDNIKCFRSWFK